MSTDDQLSDFDEKRRQLLVAALTAGVFSLNPMLANAGWWGFTPRKLEKKESIFALEGDVKVNGNKATKNTRIDADALVETGSNSNVVFAVGSDSFIVRSNSQMQLEGSNFLLDSLRLVSGKVLSVFGQRSSRQLTMSTTIATIGIRGTGVYMETNEDVSYLCTCYGKTDISSNEDPSDRISLETTHHDEPKYITKAARKNGRIIPAPFKNHTDLELKMLETLVGREVPFGLQGNLYGGARRDY
ncbi:MAG: hypothetical protein ISR69_09380 [Gammaproteobacteria bacterium]|nr:hypothetical protein [Gammaproteobacteria bacterium]